MGEEKKENSVDVWAFRGVGNEDIHNSFAALARTKPGNCLFRNIPRSNTAYCKFRLDCFQELNGFMNLGTLWLSII